jgi:hypothetical protein
MEISSTQLLLIIGIVALSAGVVSALLRGPTEFNPMATLAAVGAMMSLLWGKGR